MITHTASLPSATLLEQQARWLAPARAGLLRRAAVAHRRSVLDLGAGRGMVTAELLRRSRGTVYALDKSERALHEVTPAPSLIRIVGNADSLPLADKQLDLVFSQFALLWVGLSEALAEILRVLQPGGHFCAIEPDYRAMIEHPESSAVADVWMAALLRAGATYNVGRRLPGRLEQLGFEVEVRLLDQLRPPSPLRFAMLRELPLTAGELVQVTEAERIATTLAGWQQVSHLPLFLINATRPK